jgi:hypothetical protein
MADSVPPPIRPPSPVPPAPRTAPAAVWSLVLAVLFSFGGWLFTAIPAVICGHIARSKIRKSGGALRGTGIATAGLIIGYIGVALGIMGIPLVVGMIRSDIEQARRLAAERTEIISTEGRVRISVPGNWIQMPQLNAQAIVRAGNKSKEQYLIVLAIAKSDLENMTLQKRHQTARDRMLQSMKNASGSEPVAVTIGGFPALQDELSGTKENTKLVFLHTTVETGDHYYQILAWTLKSRWDQNKELLRELTALSAARSKRILFLLGLDASFLYFA